MRPSPSVRWSSAARLTLSFAIPLGLLATLAACGGDTAYTEPPSSDAGTDTPSADGGNDVGDVVCIDGATTTMHCPDGAQVPACTCLGGTWECEADPSNACVAPCDDGSALSCRVMEPVCGNTELLALIDGCYLCVDPGTCQPPSPTTCRSDADCTTGETCDLCARSSCPECDDCVAACVPSGCDPGGVPLCNSIRPTCVDGAVAVVHDDCWVCVSTSNCQPLPPTACETAGGFCDTADVECSPGYRQGSQDCGAGGGHCCEPDTCGDGTELACQMSPPVCQEFESLAINDGCWQCVSAVTCLPWGEPGCSGDITCQAGEYCSACATGSCPDCDDCVAGCLPHSCSTGEQIVCPEAQPECGPDAVAVGSNGCWECVDIGTCLPIADMSACERQGGYCTDFQDTCDAGTTPDGPMGCPLGRSAMCCLPRPTSCDDGSETLCERLPPVCDAEEILAVQNSCWVCVNPTTCLPWGEPGCVTDRDCGAADFCDPCGTASCPACRDCVAACAPHGCATEAEPMCNCVRPDCPEGSTSVVTDACWVCVTTDACEPVAGGCN